MVEARSCARPDNPLRITGAGAGVRTSAFARRTTAHKAPALLPQRQDLKASQAPRGKRSRSRCPGPRGGLAQDRELSARDKATLEVRVPHPVGGGPRMQPECQFTDGAAALQQVQLGGIRLAKANRTWAMISRTYINALLAARSSGLTTHSTWSPRSSTNPRPDLAKNNSRLGRCYQPAQRHQGRTGTHRKERAAAVLAAWSILKAVRHSQTSAGKDGLRNYMSVAP